MAKNLANLGISWYSEDKEVQKDIGVLHESLNGIAETLGNIKKINAFQAVVDAVNLRALQDTARSVKDTIGEVLGGQVQASEAIGPLDSYYTNAAKSAAKLAANSSTVADNMELVNKSAGIARSLNMDADAVQKMAAEFEKLGVNAEEYGFKNFQQFVKMTEVAGVEGQELVRTLKGLETGFGYSGEQAGELLDRVTYISREFGMGTQGVQNFGEVTGKLNEQLRMMGKDAGPEEFSEITESIYMLGGSMVSLGKDPAEAMSAAQDVFVKLADSQKEMKKLFIGQGNIPDLIEQGAIALGDFGSAQEMMQKAPMEFVQQLGKNYGQLSEQQKMFLDQNVLSEFDADVDWMVKGNWKKVEKTLGNVKSNLDDASGAAGDMAGHYRTGYTWGERLNMVTEDYEQRLAQISQGALGSTFLKRQRMFYLDTLAPAFESIAEGTFMIEESTSFMNTHFRKLTPRLQITNEQFSDIQETLAKTYAGFRAGGIEGAMVAFMEVEPVMEAIAKHAGVTVGAVREANESGYVDSFKLMFEAAKGYSEELREDVKYIWNGLKMTYPWLNAFEVAWKLSGEFAKQLRSDAEAVLPKVKSFMSLLTVDDVKDGVDSLKESFGGLFGSIKTGAALSAVSLMPGGGLLAGGLGLGGALTSIEDTYEGGIEQFMKDMGKKIEPMLKKAKPYMKDVADAFTKFFRTAFEMINWPEVGEKIGDMAGTIFTALGEGLSLAMGGDEGRDEMEKKAKQGNMQAKMSLMMGTMFEGMGDAFVGVGEGILSSMWEGMFGAADEEEGGDGMIASAGKTVAGMFVAGVMTGIAAFFTRSKILKALGAVLRAPIMLPIKFVFGTTKAATKGYLTAKAISKLGDVAAKSGMAGDVGKLEARMAGASGKEAKAVKSQLRRAKMGQKLRGTGTKIAGAATKAVKKTGFIGRALGLTAAAEKAKVLGSSLQAAGGVAPEAMKGMTFMKSLKGVLAESKLVKFFKLLGKVGKSVGKVLRPVFKIVQKIVGPIIMIYEYFKRLPTIISNFSDIFTEALHPDELTKKGFEIAKSFASVLDAWFLNIPSWIGEKLGITSELVEGFYQFLVLQTSLAIDDVVTFFSTFGERVTGIYYGIKATAIETFVATGLNAMRLADTMIGYLFDYYEGATNIFFDIAKVATGRFVDMQNKASLFVNEVKRMFATIYNVVIHDVFEPIVRQFSKVVGEIFKKLMSNPVVREAMKRLGYGKEGGLEELANFHENIYGEDYNKQESKDQFLKDIGVLTADQMSKTAAQRRQNATAQVEAGRASVQSGLASTERQVRGGLQGAGGAMLQAAQREADEANELQRKSNEVLEEGYRQKEQRDRRARQRAQTQTMETLKGPGSATPAGRDKMPEDKKQTKKLEDVASSSAKSAEETRKLREVAERLERNFNRPFPKRTTGDEAP